MKCISVIAQRHVYAATMWSSVHTTRERYPKAEGGIRVHADVRQVDMARGTTVRVKERFFQPGMPADHAVWIGRYVHILRASVVYDNAVGDFVLTPETDPTDQRVLVYLDVSSGDSERVVYETLPFSVVSRGAVSAFPYLTSEEVVLATMAPGETITATRARRRWLFWGEFQTTETITYSLTGDGTIGSLLVR